MNKRIQELAEQAGIHFGRSATLDGRDIARFVTASDMEKFAELIVEECINIVGAGGEFASRPKLVEKLKEHFGVEL
jgi:2,4-dienoyl-CoA reductase-like NADH-dependent reductase (Old Yellow Enzyme family)